MPPQALVGAPDGPAGGVPRENAKSVGQTLRGAAAKDRRRGRWSRRLTFQRFLDWQAAQDGSWDVSPARRQAGCGRCSFAPGGVELRATMSDDGAVAYPAGVQSCGSIHACPVCSAKIRARRAIETQLAAMRHVEAGGTLGMVTLTVRHHRQHSLTELVEGLRTAWRRVQQRRDWRPVRAQLRGSITATEVTFGENGWHPHLHLLLFLERDGQAVLDDLAGWLPEVWRSTVAGVLDESPDLAHGTHVQQLDADGAKYVAKVADETTRGDLKSDARSPWALLDGMADGDAASVARWMEYVAAMKGRRAIVWSRGLRDDLLPDVEDVTDDEAAAQLLDGLLVERLDAGEWYRLAVTRSKAGVVQAVERLEVIEARLDGEVRHAKATGTKAAHAQRGDPPRSDDG